jgi:hypothetical protein
MGMRQPFEIATGAEAHGEGLSPASGERWRRVPDLWAIGWFLSSWKWGKRSVRWWGFSGGRNLDRWRGVTAVTGGEPLWRKRFVLWWRRKEKGNFPPWLASFTFYSRRGGDGADTSPPARASCHRRRGAAAALAHRGAHKTWARSHPGGADT